MPQGFVFSPSVSHIIHLQLSYMNLYAFEPKLLLLSPHDEYWILQYLELYVHMIFQKLQASPPRLKNRMRYTCSFKGDAMVATELDLCSVRDGERWWPPTIEHKKARLQMPYLCRKPLGSTKYQNHNQEHLSTCPSQTWNYAVKSDLFLR